MTPEERNKKFAIEHPKVYEEKLELATWLSERQKRRQVYTKVSLMRDELTQMYKSGKTMEELMTYSKKSYQYLQTMLGSQGIKTPAPTKEHIPEDMRARYMDYANRKLSGETLESIGDIYGVSRERIRQVLKMYFPDIKFPKQHHPATLSRVEKKCFRESCTNIMSGLNSYVSRHPYCSRQCYLINTGKNIVNISSMTKEEFRVFNNNRCKNYYHRVLKHKPDFQKKVKEYNRLASEKNSIKKEKQAAYQRTSKKSMGGVQETNEEKIRKQLLYLRGERPDWK